MHELHNLRVKRKTLAAEGMIIKIEEAKERDFRTKTQFKAALSIGMPHPSQREDSTEREYWNEVRGYFKSDAYKAKIAEERIAKRLAASIARQVNFREHRVRVVRRAARVAHLAHGFIKGMPYERIEQSQRTLVTKLHFAQIAVEIAKDVGNFGKPEQRNSTSEDRVASILGWMGQ